MGSKRYTEPQAFEKLKENHPKVTKGKIWQRIYKFFKPSEYESPNQMYKEFKFLPDAYEINKDDRSIVMYEIENTNRLSDLKLRKIAWCWFSLDCEDIELSLVITNRFGTGEHTMDLSDIYYKNLGKFLK